MSSPIYDLFAQAMQERTQVHCIYRGRPRAVCPIILGHTNGQEVALVFQVGGESSQPLSREGAWRCLRLAEVSSAQLHEGPWRSGLSHRQSQPCVKDVDLDVNPNSPYSPRRRIEGN